jgi:hypothetical protein
MFVMMCETLFRRIRGYGGGLVAVSRYYEEIAAATVD